MEKFKIGDKVKLPVDKITVSGYNWERSYVRRELPAGQDYLYVVKLYPEDGEVTVGANPTSRASNYKEEDLELYTPISTGDKDSTITVGTQFYCKVDPTKLVYTISKIEEDTLWVSWKRSEEKTISYSVSQVEEYIKNGEWILIENPLPEKWCIQRTAENYEEVNAWFEKQFPEDSFSASTNYLHYPAEDYWSSYSSLSKEGYEEITIEQFRQITGKTMNNKKGKIIGYKAPFALYGGLIEKGTIYPNKEDTPEEAEINNYLVPIEIVRTWEPVYEPEEKVLVLGDKKIEVKIGKGYIRVKEEDFTYEDVEALQRIFIKTSTMMLAEHHIRITSLHIGCELEGVKVTEQEIREVLQTYRELNNN
jgi:hypothetical protein